MENTLREYIFISSEQRKLKESGYAAISYVDHRSDGMDLSGSEDFSLERWKSSVTSRCVYVPTGAKDKGGNARWEKVYTVWAENAKACGQIAKFICRQRAFQMRKY